MKFIPTSDSLNFFKKIKYSIDYFCMKNNQKEKKSLSQMLRNFKKVHHR